MNVLIPFNDCRTHHPDWLLKKCDVVRAVGEVEAESVGTIANGLPAEGVGVEGPRLFHIDAADGEVAKQRHR
jgi:hypothetical protein